MYVHKDEIVILLFFNQTPPCDDETGLKMLSDGYLKGMTTNWVRADTFRRQEPDISGSVRILLLKIVIILMEFQVHIPPREIQILINWMIVKFQVSV